VHGDYHPWNILFRQAVDFKVLDRSPGRVGEHAADDMSAMSINYIFYALQAYGSLAGPFEKLHRFFWNLYLEKTGYGEMLDVIQPLCLEMPSHSLTSLVSKSSSRHSRQTAQFRQ